MRNNSIHSIISQIGKLLYCWLPYIPIIGLLMVVSAIPYGWSDYQRIGTYILGIGYGLWFIVYRQWRNIRWSHTKWLYVIMLAIYIMIPIRQMFDSTPPTRMYWRLMHIHEWFLYIGLAGIIGFPKDLKLKYVAYTMFLSSLAMAAYCVYLYFYTDEFIKTPLLVRMCFLRNQHLSSHMIVNLYLNTALIMGFYSLSETKKWWVKCLVVVSMLLAFGLIFVSNGRIGLITALVIIAIGSIYHLLGKNIYVALIAVMAVVALSFIAVSNHSRISVEKVTHDPRVAIWDYSVRMIEEKPILGYGLSTLSEVYVEKAYTDSVMYNGFVLPIIENNPYFKIQGKTLETHHPHNAFLAYWLEYGVIGVVLLLLLILFSASLPLGKNRIYMWLFLLAFVMQCMTEPIGAHLLPQMIAITLFVFEQTNPTVQNDYSCNQANLSNKSE